MTGVERAGIADPALMLAFLRDKTSARKFRLFACACCRLVWPLLTDAAARARVVAVEHQAEGRTAVPPPRPANLPAPRVGDSPALYAEVASIFAGCSDPFAAALVASAMVERADPRRGGRAVQADLLADLCGRPTIRLDRRCRTAEIKTLAQAISDQRRFQDLPRLADLLKAAGCPPQNLLDHCRSGGPHVLGCWALDLVLGKS